MRKGFERFLIALLRLSMGWTLLWVFLDKLWGLGFSTPSGQAWVDGVSPTASFLLNETEGSPLADVFYVLAEQEWTDWLFMVGLAFVGVSLILGIMTRLAGTLGALIMFFIFLAVMPPTENPIITYHFIYILVFLLLAVVPSGEWFGLGKKWNRTWLTRGFPFLK